MLKSLNWKISGMAGNGIKSVGEIMAKALSRSGYRVFGYTEFPSLIRGGHNTYQVWADEKSATAPKKMLDVLVALNQDGIDLHKSEVNEQTVIIADEGLNFEDTVAKALKVPMDKMVSQLAEPLVRNTLALGVSAAEMAIDLEIFVELIKQVYGHKEKVLELNLRALQEGYKMHPNPLVKSEKAQATGNYVLAGNEAAGLGAIAAGVQFYAGYPMTPTTTLLHFLAEHQTKYGYILRQTEDELSAINMVIGASYAGAKAMTATSGGGFDLMQEGLSLSGILELPIVIDLGMRPGPATGLPTWTSQSDLRLAVHGGHGEFPRIVLAPGDPTEAYELMHQSFVYSQMFQIPVIILTDKHLNESHFTVEELKPLPTVPLMNVTLKANQPEGEMFHRFQPTSDGISERTLPGVANGFYIANSDEHNAVGIVDESAEMREVMNHKRKVKMERIRSQMPLPILYGPKTAKKTIVAWGSNKGLVLEALKDLEDVNLIHFNHMWPFHPKVAEMLADKKLIFLENNITGQLAGMIRQEFGIEGDTILRDNGRPFFPEEIIEMVNSIK